MESRAILMDGQPRTGSNDKGADEASSDPVVAALLVPGDMLRLIHGRR